MSITVTTDLPDEDQPVLGNGVEDEVAVDRESAVSNNGDVRIQIRETGQSSWDSNATGYAEQVLNYDTLTTIFPGREDGEEYEVRARTETEHVTGSWTTPVTITTKFPGASSFSITGTATTSVDMSWTDNSDNEDGFRVYRAEEVDGGFSSFKPIEDLPPNTTSYTDNTAQPSTTYRYYVEAYTEHTSADSSTADTTTNPTGRPQRRAKSDGWYAEVEHPDGRSIGLEIIGTPLRRPKLNGLPRVEIPVPRDEAWQSGKYERAPMRVYYDGELAPIDELVDVEMHPDHTRLIGRGGKELLTKVSAEYDAKEAYTAMRDLVENNTPYTANFDDPATSTDQDVLVQESDSDSEFTSNLLDPFPSNDPRYLENGKVKQKQVCWTVEAEDYSSGNPTLFRTPDYSGVSPTEGSAPAIEFNTNGIYAEWKFTPNYDIPEGEFEIRYRNEGSDNPPNLQWSLNGAEIGSSTDQLLSLGWSEVFSAAGETAPALSAGVEYTIRAESVTDDGGRRWIDVVSPLDGRYSYTMDNSVTTAPDGSNYLDGPEFYADQLPTVFDDVNPAESVVAGKLEVTMNDTGGQQELAISNDSGATWITGSNTSSFSGAFGSAGGSIRARVTLSRFGSRTTTPATGFNPQELDAYSLYADLEDSPVIVNKRYEGQLINILSDIADYSNFIFEFQRSQSGDVVEGTQPGLRSTSGDESIANYQVTKRTSESYEEVTVYGSSQQWVGERFNSNHGTSVDLDQSYILETSEVVYNRDTGTKFVRGDDYRMNYEEGKITTLSSGAMSDSTEYTIDYRYKTRGVATSATADGSLPELVERIPGITSNRGCEQAALQIVQKINEPLYEARVVLADRPKTFELIDAIDLEDLPTDGNNMVVWELQQEPGNTVLRLGSRPTLQEVSQRIQAQVSGVSDRV